MCIHNEWESDKIYNAGDIVFQDKKHWQANFWVTGTEPDMYDSAWTFLGYCECIATNGPVTSGTDEIPVPPMIPVQPESVEESESVCKTHPMWTKKLHWTEYSVGEKFVNGGGLWEVVKPEWCYHEPSGENGTLGWKKIANC